MMRAGRARQGLLVCCVALLALAAPLRAADDAGPHAGPDAAAGAPIVVPAPPPEAPSVVAVPSAREVELARPFYLLVRVTHAPGVRVNLPAALELGPAIEERRRTDGVAEAGDGRVTRTFELELMAFDVGELIVPPLPVIYAASGRSAEVASEPVSITVAGVLGDDEPELRDIAPPVPVATPNWPLVYAAAALAALFLVAALLLAARRWRRPRAKRRRPGRVAAPHLPPHEEALARLDEVEASGLVDAADRKPAYHELSEIVRGYLGRRYDFPALDLTTGEIRAHLSEMAGGERAAELLGDWLERCDLVKFAGADASPDEARQALYDARRFVEQTRADDAAAEASGA